MERAQYRSHRVVERDEEWTGRLSIHCECTTFNLQEIFNYFRERPPYIARWLRQDVVHLRKLRSEVDLIEDAVWWSGVEDPFAGAAEMFLFSYGVLSTWGLSEGGEWELRETLKQFQLTDFGMYSLCLFGSETLYLLSLSSSLYLLVSPCGTGRAQHHPVPRYILKWLSFQILPKRRNYLPLPTSRRSSTRINNS